MGAPCSAPIQGCAERQWGTAIFSRGHQMGNIHILPRVIGSVASPWLRLVSLALPRLRRRWRGFPSPSIFPPPRPRGPGYTPRPLARPGHGIDRSDPMDRAGSAGRVRRTRPTAESKAAARRRSGWARSARSQIAGYSEARKATSRRLLRRKPERRRVCALQTGYSGASDHPPPFRFCFPRIQPTEFARHSPPPGGRRRY